MRTLVRLPRLVLFAALLVSSSAFAQYYGPPPPPPPGYYYGPPRPSYVAPPPPPFKFFTLTFQPLMLAPIEQGQEFFELGAEFKVVPWLGLELLGGVGAYSDCGVIGAVGCLNGVNYELGGEANFYVVGAFRRGVMLSPFVRYMGSNDGSSLQWGGLIGYKWSSWAGFTWEIQGGVGVLQMLANDDPQNATGDGLVPNDLALPWPGAYGPYRPGDVAVQGLLRFALGWSI